MFEGGFGCTELGDVLLELGALATVFDEEASITFVRDLHLLNHSIMFSFERCDLVRECMIRGRGVGQGLRPCREVNHHCREFCFHPLVLCFEVYILSREFGVGLCAEFLLVAPRCLSSVELLGKFVASGLLSEQLLLEEVVGGGLACVSRVGIPYLGGQDLVPCAGLLLFVSGLLGLFVDLE